MSIVDEINKDLEKMGGDTSGQTVEDAMDKFGDKIIEEIGEATELPAVTAEDEGDVLMVGSDGKWGKGEIPSQLPEIGEWGANEGKVLGIRNAEWKKVDNPVQTVDLTGVDSAEESIELLSEVIEKTGDGVINFYFEDDDTSYNNLPYAVTLDNEGEAVEQLDVYISTSAGVTKKTYTSEGVTTTALKELPAVTSADEGDVLTVNSNGEWVASNDSSFVYIRIDASGSFVDAGMTYGKLKELVNAGKMVFIIDSDRIVLTPSYAENPHNGSYPISFYGAKVTYSSSPRAITAIEHHYFVFENTTASSAKGYIMKVTTTFS